MTVQYKLEVIRDMRLLGYDKRLKASRELVSAIACNKLHHKTLNEAVKAAKAISRQPLVVSVALTRVETSPPIVYRNGK